jgi:hypothetical protein
VILELAIAAALVVAPPVEDVQLPTCAAGEEAQPFEDAYVCGPADEATPDPLPTFTPGPAPVVVEPPAPSAPPTATQTPTPVPTPPTLAETGIAEERVTSLAIFAAIAIALGTAVVLALFARGPQRARRTNVNESTIASTALAEAGDAS